MAAQPSTAVTRKPSPEYGTRVGDRGAVRSHFPGSETLAQTCRRRGAGSRSLLMRSARSAIGDMPRATRVKRRRRASPRLERRGATRSAPPKANARSPVIRRNSLRLLTSEQFVQVSVPAASSAPVTRPSRVCGTRRLAQRPPNVRCLVLTEHQPAERVYRANVGGCPVRRVIPITLRISLSAATR